jgi:hypothetical protein
MGGETHNYRRKLNDDERAIAKNRDSISGIID